MLKEYLAKKDDIDAIIYKSKEINSVLYKDCERLVPFEYNPQCIEVYIDIKEIPKTVNIYFLIHHYLFGFISISFCSFFFR